MLKNGVLVGFGPSDPKENLILSLEVEHVKSNFKSDSALHCRAISKKQTTVVTIISFCNFFYPFCGPILLFIGCLKSGFLVSEISLLSPGAEIAKVSPD